MLKVQTPISDVAVMAPNAASQSIMTTTTTTTATTKPLSKSSEIALQIRERFLNEEYSRTPELYDEDDIRRLKTSEWFVKRFVISAGRDAKVAYDTLRTTLLWKKSVEINTTPMNSFPSEFFKIGGLFDYEADREGHPVVYMRIRMHRKIPELAEPIQQFLFHTINRIDRQVDGQGLVVVFDCTEAGYQNMDIDMLRALIDITFKYFPFSVNKVIVYELSWMLSAFRRLAMTFIPAAFKRIIVFTDKTGITDHIAIENLPDFMGGTCERNYRVIPRGCPPVDKLAEERGIAPADVERITAIFEPYLLEAEAEIAKRPQVHYPQEECEETGSDSGVSTEQDISSDGQQQQPLALVTRPSSLEKCQEFISIFPQNVINFARIRLLNPSGSERNHDNGLSGSILVRNTRNESIAFKVQTTDARRFTVTPSAGILMADAWIRIVVRGVAPSEDDNCGGSGCGKFLLLLCSSPSNAEKHVESRRAFDALFTDAAAQNRLVTHRLATRILDSTESSLTTTRQTFSNSQPNKDREIVCLRKEFAALARSQRRMQLSLVAMILFIVLLLLGALSSGGFFEFLSPLRPNSGRIEL